MKGLLPFAQFVFTTLSLVSFLCAPGAVQAAPTTFTFVGPVTTNVYGSSGLRGITSGATITGTLTLDPTTWTLVSSSGSGSNTTLLYLDLTASLDYTAHYEGTNYPYHYPAATNYYSYPYPGIEISISTNNLGTNGVPYSAITIYYSTTDQGYFSTFFLNYTNTSGNSPAEVMQLANEAPSANSFTISGFVGGNFGYWNYFGPAAQLGATQSGNNLVLWWPTNNAGYQLQSCAWAGTNAMWNDVTNPPVVTNLQCQVCLPISTNANVFYRLRSAN